MSFNDQYKAQLDRYEQFWNRANTDRPVLNLVGPKQGAVSFKKPESLEQRWLDEEYVINRFRHYRENTDFVGDAVPMLFTDFGPGCLSACIGGNYDLGPNTIWLDRRPIIEDWEDLPNIEFNENSEMWQNVLRLQNKFLTDPSVHFSVTDIGGIMDIIASLRGTQELLYDVYDYPDEIKELSKRITQIWKKVFDQQIETVKKSGLPYNTWMEIPSAKPWYPLQCDFSYMLSPDHFREFVLDDLTELAQYVERPIYHLDGVGELPHLDMILEIPGLMGIQWAPGAGEAPEWDEKWFPIYRKIQDKNKLLILRRGLLDADEAGAEKLIKTVDPAGLYISTRFKSGEDAKRMYENILKWSK
ncbi:MAG: hypothetical protein IJN82_00660 [Clostridia bacterium]|nr:hypothetical protein [Clostridia bacterium]